MKTTKILTILVVAFGLTVCLAQLCEAEPMGTAFTYQGHLYDNNEVADGLYDFQFKLYDDPCDANQIGSDVNKPDVDVIAAYFTVELDFGSDVFDGNSVWLETGVRPGELEDPNVYTILEPRLELTPVPYALYAETVSSTAGGIEGGGIEGGGTDNYIAKFTGPNTLGDSTIYEYVGNVGIGTTPLSNTRLSIQMRGKAGPTGGFNAPGLVIKGGSWNIGNQLEVQDPSGDTRFLVNSAGKVGIGTPSPSEKLEVNGKVKATAFVGDGSGLTGIATGDSDWIISGNNMYSIPSGRVGIGTDSPGAKLHVESLAGTAVRGEDVVSTDTGYLHNFFPEPLNDGQPIWGVTEGYLGGSKRGAFGLFTRVVPPGTIPYTNYAYLGGYRYGLYAYANSLNGWAGYFEGRVYIKGNTTVRGKLYIKDSSTGETVIKLGAGLDYAEGFDVSESTKIDAGSVLIIDADNPGKLAMSDKAYDSKVAGIVAGAKGQGSGVRLGSEQFDYDVALAGRVYCNVDAAEAAVEPGDLLTTSATPGYAMKAADYMRAQGAILGKAMESLEKGQKGQILVLVTLQ